MLNFTNPLSRALAAALLCVLASVSMQARSESRYGVLNMQNDLFVGRDGGGYTNGTFLATVRASSREEAPLRSPALLTPIAPWLGVSKASLVSYSAGQIIVTPRDLRRATPDPEDAPYVGGLAFRAAQIDVRGNRSDLVALSLGGAALSLTGVVIGWRRLGRKMQRAKRANRSGGSTKAAPARAARVR